MIPDPDWKRIYQGENWATGDTYIATIGQGYVDVTPLQVLESIATIANGGKVMKPTLLKNYLDGEGNVIQTFRAGHAVRHHRRHPRRRHTTP